MISCQFCTKKKNLLFIKQKASISIYRCHAIECFCPKKLFWKSFLDTILQSRSLCNLCSTATAHCTLRRRDILLSTGVLSLGVPGGAMAHPDFGRSVNPISTRGDKLCPPNYYWHPRIFRSSNGSGLWIFRKPLQEGTPKSLVRSRKNLRISMKNRLISVKIVWLNGTRYSKELAEAFSSTMLAYRHHAWNF